jgi:hypothetical protein
LAQFNALEDMYVARRARLGFAGRPGRFKYASKIRPGAGTLIWLSGCRRWHEGRLEVFAETFNNSSDQSAWYTEHIDIDRKRC